VSSTPAADTGRVGGPRHRGPRRRFGGAGWDDEQVDLVAPIGGGDQQRRVQAGEPAHPDHPRAHRQPPEPAVPGVAVEQDLPDRPEPGVEGEDQPG